MGLKPGYRQTEVGAIPENWNVAHVGQAFDICNNLRLPISQAVREKMVGAFPYYGPTDIQGYINEYRVEGEYALIGEDGDHFLKWRDRPMTLLVNGRFNVNNHAHLVRGTNNLTAWFYYYFSHRDIAPYLTRQGAGRYKLTKSSLENIPCALPPLLEQDAIAEALSDADVLIKSIERLIAKKHQVKQGVMQELLTGEKRLTRFTEPWEMKSLGEVAPLQRGFDLPNSKLQQGSYPVVYSNGVLNHHTAFQVKSPGVVTGRSGTIGTVTFVEQDFWPHNTSLWVTTFKGNNPKFVFYLYTRIGLERFATGSGVPTLNRNDVHAFKVRIPPTKAEQEAIAEVLSDMDAEIAALEDKLAKASRVKLGMMHNLLTGSIRLV